MKNYVTLILLSLISFVSQAQIKAEFTVQDTLCAGQLVIFKAKSDGVSYYNYNFGDVPSYTGWSTYVDSVVGHTYSTAGTYYVKLMVMESGSNPLQDTIEKIIYVRPAPTAQFSLEQYALNNVFCINTEFSISAWSNMKGFDSLAWDFGDGFTSEVRFPVHGYDTAGTYRIKASAFGKCGVATDSQTIVVKDNFEAKPSISLYASPMTVCNGQSVFINSYLQDEVDSVSITTGDGKQTALTEFEYTFEQTGDYDLQAISFNTCGSDTANLTVHVVDTVDNMPGFSVSPRATCSGQPIRFSLMTNYLLDGKVNFQDGQTMDFTDTTGLIYHSYSTDGTYDVEIIFNYKNCALPDTSIVQITIGSGSAPYRPYISTYPQIACPGQEVNVNLAYITPGDTLDVWYGDGSMERFVDQSSQAQHTYAAHGNYYGKCILTNACGLSDSSFFTQVIDSANRVTLSISSNQDAVGAKNCIQDTIYYYASSDGAEIQNMLWKFHDGSSQSGYMAKMPYSSAGDFLVEVTAENSCGITGKKAYTTEITDHMINPSFNFYFYPLAGCVNEAFLFDVIHSGAQTMMVDYGDGTTEYPDIQIPHITHAYGDPGRYTATLTASNQCGTVMKSAYPRVVAGPTVDFSFENKNYMTGDTVHFTNTSSGYRQHIWIFNNDLQDTSTMDAPYRVYATQGTYTIMLLAENEFGCYDTLSKQVTIGEVGIKGIAGEEFVRIYPNPTKGMLTVRLEKHIGNGLVELRSLNGQLLESASLSVNSETNLNLDNLSNGLYLVHIIGDGFTHTSRVILSR